MVTNNHYRWDFIGLSTDEKPTPATSPKVTDGSTFYCSDTSKLYVYCKDNWYERKPLGGGGGGGSYTAGTGIDITEDVISVDTDTIQEKLTAGTGINITDNVISSTGGGGDTVYSDKSTSNSNTGGAVYIGNLNASQEEQPDPTTTDNHYKYFWALPYNNAGLPVDASINIFGQVEGTNSIVLGQNAISRNEQQISIGSSALNNYNSTEGVAIGRNAQSLNASSVALGARAHTSRAGEVNIGNVSGEGYNSTNYRVLGGVHDGQLAQDAVTVNQINGLIDAINTAASLNIPHIGA